MTNPDDAPILDFDPARDAVLEPHLAIQAVRPAPPHVVLCFFREAPSRSSRCGARRPRDRATRVRARLAPRLRGGLDGRRVAVTQAGVGAPLAAGWLDGAHPHAGRPGVHFVAVPWRCRRPRARPRHRPRPERAGSIRDEGTSYHYLPPRAKWPDRCALEAISIATLEAHGVPYVTGKTWTGGRDLPRDQGARSARRVAERLPHGRDGGSRLFFRRRPVPGRVPRAEAALLRRRRPLR